MDWSLLLLSMPTGHTAPRMRAWRALKAGGAAVLRDGAYLLPATGPCLERLRGVAADVRESEGSAHLLRVQSDDGTDFTVLFDRSGEYDALRSEIESAHAALGPSNPAESMKHANRLRRSLESIAELDYFPGDAGRQARTALESFDADVRRALAPDEPTPAESRIERLERADFAGRRWATRRRPWVDRLASAWLIRRHVDPQARFLWLESPSDCPDDALGFDYDGARFTHVGERVTFEVLLASFSLETPALLRVGELVRHVDVGGAAPAEAAGVERVLAGLCELLHDDDVLFQAAAAVFEGLHAGFEREEKKR